MQSQHRTSWSTRVAAEASPALKKPQMSAKPQIKEQAQEAAAPASDSSDADKSNATIRQGTMSALCALKPRVSALFVAQFQ